MGNKINRGAKTMVTKPLNSKQKNEDTPAESTPTTSTAGTSSPVEEVFVPAPVPELSVWDRPADKRKDSKAYAAEAMLALYGMSEARVEKAKTAIASALRPKVPLGGGTGRIQRDEKKTVDKNLRTQANKKNGLEKARPNLSPSMPKPFPPAPKVPTKEEIYCFDAPSPTAKTGVNWASLGAGVKGESTILPISTSAGKFLVVQKGNKDH